jgi:hypothetical protein
LVFIERAYPERRYYTQVGQLGIYYRDTSAAPVRDDDGLTEQLMAEVVDAVRGFLQESPVTGPKKATALLQARYRPAPVR